MSTCAPPSPRGKLDALRATLVTWLTNSAYPLWAEKGIDATNGGFIETIDQSGTGLPHPRRARVHPRQIYAFAQAPRLGWSGDVTRVVTRGMEYFTANYRRTDGLFRTLAGVDGAPLDHQAVLYDQAFALLGYAAAGDALNAVAAFEERAVALLRAVETRFGLGDGAFRSTETTAPTIESNPHMHLLEACLAWAQLGTDPVWNATARRLVELALGTFIHTSSGALGESFGLDRHPLPGIAGKIVEPGHQFEWAWLLMRAAGRKLMPGRELELRNAALRLVAIGEEHGVHNGVAVNALLDDFSLHDANARFWPQTERLKAALFAAELTGDERYLNIAATAAESLFGYLNTPVKGLWLDIRLPSGELVDSPAPASTFYHLVGAIVTLVDATQPPQAPAPA